jgi:thiosulfate dehydrogenase (quinone) large subunit
MSHKAARWLLAAIQAILGWEWLMSGSNKLLAGTFPQGLADTITSLLKDNPNGWYVSFLQHAILPQSILYGYLIEWTEVAIGLLLLGGALILLGQPRGIGQPQYRLMVAYNVAAMCAALTGTFMTVNFHFLMGGWVFPWFDTTTANGEGIDLDALLPAFSLVIILAHGALIVELTEVSWSERLQRVRRRLFPQKPLSSDQTALAKPVSEEKPQGIKQVGIC